VRTWAFTLEGDVLELTDASATFDFTLTGGVEVPATEVVVLVRR
jgi:hypothetical protein